ncbi:MAG: hypothetical protein ACJ8KA_04945 [Sulfurifustis sp.]
MYDAGRAVAAARSYTFFNPVSASTTFKAVSAIRVARGLVLERNRRDAIKKPTGANMTKRLILATAVLLLAGCATTYIPPGPKADLQLFAPSDIQAAFATEPSNPFPASMAVIRVQGPGYSNYQLQQRGGRYGTGRYSVVLAHEIDEDSQLARLNELPQFAGWVTINRMLLPEQLENDREIRGAASRLQADLVFLCTFDTSFFDSDVAKPLSVITLGLSPTRKISAVTTASALLMDTRTGYIYSAYEATEKIQTLSSFWGSRDSADEARRTNEEAAFKKLVDELVTSWPKLLERHVRRSR